MNTRNPRSRARAHARAADAAAHVRESSVGFALLQERPGVEQAWPKRGSRIDRVPKRREVRELAAEIEDGRDTCGQEQWSVPAVRPEHVDVHVGEAGNQEAPASVDDLRTLGRRALRRRTDA